MKPAQTVLWIFAAIAAFAILPAAARAAARDDIDLSGPGWKIWHDDAAEWKNDTLYLPPVDLTKIPTNPPTGGWQVLDTGKDASIPATAEEYLQKIPGPEGDITGVTWFTRTITIPASPAPRRILLRFEAVRQRAEVYVNQKLVGYDMIGNTPFEVDLSSSLKPGDKAQLAVRITDPGGNFDWHDKGLIDWGKNQILFGHGFGGITGRVKLIACDPAYIDDIYVQNTPAITDINTEITLRNTTDAPIRRDLVLSVLDKKNRAAAPLVVQRQANIEIAPGSSTVKVNLSYPQAKLWDPDNPNLYVCQAQLVSGEQPGDATAQTFGFRWFEPVGIGTNAMFRLNGKRIVLRSAISWGFFPTNGLYATSEIAERQIRIAKELGQNMLNFHRAMGQPIIFEKADELGLLYYQEPGNYDNGANNQRVIPRAMAREKVLRMVKRDRSHPSLIIYCMSNETGPSDASLAVYAEDMKAMHALDPSRIITRSSGLRSALGIDNEISTKWHYRPFDETLYKTGWYDDHHAGGPAVYTQDAYKDPKDYFHLINDPQEINFWGEEGDLHTPALGLIKDELARQPNLGWDGGMYLAWYKMFDDFIGAKNLRSAFPTVDSLCKAMGNISMEHQGRTIEIIRLNNDSDAYCINGWESEILENHSGIVDCFRNPKGDPAIMAYYNQPLYIAVMVRNQVVAPTGKVVVDFYIINEKDVKGAHRLAITAADAAGKQVFAKSVDVTVKGGDMFGQLLAEGVEIPIAGSVGSFHIQAELLDSKGVQTAAGHDDILSVDWKSDKLAGAGAVLDGGGRVRQFLVKQKGMQVADYADGVPHEDWVVVTSAPNAAAPAIVPAAQLMDPTGTKAGLEASFFTDQQFGKQVHGRVDETVDLYAPDGAPPDPAVAALGNYSVRWEGKIVPPATGAYGFVVQGSGTATVTIDGSVVSTSGRGATAAAGRGGRGAGGGRGAAAGAAGGAAAGVQLVAGKAVSIKVEWVQGTGDAECRLLWSVPVTVPPPSAQKLIDRVRNEGTTLIVLENAAAWLELAKSVDPEVKYNGSFRVGTTWAGGVHFVREHPLFKDLPVNGPMDWPYQAVVRDGNSRTGLLLEADELAAGAFHANTPLATPPAPINLGTAVGVVRCGKGKIVVSTLDITGNLAGAEGPPDVARKLLCNFIAYAGGK